MSKSNSRNRSKTIQVRATAEEKSELKSRAAAFGISVGELVRQIIFRAKPKSKTDQEAVMELAQARADLGRLGGLLKGALVGSFPNSELMSQMQTRELLHEIEGAQIEVINAVKKLVVKA